MPSLPVYRFSGDVPDRTQEELEQEIRAAAPRFPRELEAEPGDTFFDACDGIARSLATFADALGVEVARARGLTPRTVRL